MGPALTALLIAASTALAAQSVAPPTKLQSPPDGSTVTVTGCLTKGEPAGSFILTNVHFDSVNTPTTGQGQHHDQKQPPAPSAPPPMTTPTTPSTAPAESAAKKTADDALQRATTAPPRESLRLAGAASQLKLSDHVGHTITATGMLGAADPVVRPGIVLPDGPAAAKADAKPAGDAPMRVLNIRSLTHVAAGCK
jgi:hypothetical protein